MPTFYEMQAIAAAGAVDPADLDAVPPIPNGPAKYTFNGQPVGSYLTVRVRGNGSKGPSPWTETTTIRIN